MCLLYKSPYHKKITFTKIIISKISEPIKTVQSLTTLLMGSNNFTVKDKAKLTMIHLKLCGPRKWGLCKWRECIDSNNKVAIFTHNYVALLCLIRMAPKLQWECPPLKEDYEENLPKHA